MFINYDYYRIFYYVAKHQNVTKAANILGSNQANITRTIQKLERELNCTLFIRSNRGVKLTPEGQKLYVYVANAVEQIQKGEQAIRTDSAMQNATVAIGTSGTALHVIVLPVLKQFHKIYPDIHIHISNDLTMQTLDAVTNGLVDFSVVATHIKVSQPLIQIPVMPYQDILIGGPSYSHLSNQVHSLASLQCYPFVSLKKETLTYQFYSQFCYQHKVTYKAEMEASTTEQILPMVQSDLGIGFIPEICAKEALAAKDVFQIPLAEEIPHRQICLIENENYPLSIAANALKALLLKPLQEI